MCLLVHPNLWFTFKRLKMVIQSNGEIDTLTNWALCC
jgi:hypothetical protein